MIIKVTQDDIDKGEVSSHCNCPISRAIKRHTGLLNIATGGRTVTYNKFVNQSSIIMGSFTLPLAAREFIERFDSDESVVPFEFEIKDI